MTPALRHEAAAHAIVEITRRSPTMSVAEGRAILNRVYEMAGYAQQMERVSELAERPRDRRRGWLRRVIG